MGLSIASAAKTHKIQQSLAACESRVMHTATRPVCYVSACRSQLSEMYVRCQTVECDTRRCTCIGRALAALLYGCKHSSATIWSRLCRGALVLKDQICQWLLTVLARCSLLRCYFHAMYVRKHQQSPGGTGPLTECFRSMQSVLERKDFCCLVICSHVISE